MATQYSAQMPQATQAATWALAGVSRREGARVANLPIPVATRHPFRAVTDRERVRSAVRVLQPPRMYRERSENVTSCVTTSRSIRLCEKASQLS